MPPSAAEICRQHLSFTIWADSLMLDALALHLPDNLTTMQHIYLAELVWYDRVSGQADAQITHYAAPATVEDLTSAFREIHGRWLAWATATDDFDAVIPHRNLKGDAFRMPAWQIVLHLTNHGSFHRGQVAAMLRAAGHPPPATDLIIWYRSQAA